MKNSTLIISLGIIIAAIVAFFLLKGKGSTATVPETNNTALDLAPVKNYGASSSSTYSAKESNARVTSNATTNTLLSARQSQLLALIPENKRGSGLVWSLVK